MPRQAEPIARKDPRVSEDEEETRRAPLIRPRPHARSRLRNVMRQGRVRTGDR